MEFPVYVWFGVLILGLTAATLWWSISRPPRWFTISIYALVILIWWFAFATRGSR